MNLMGIDVGTTSIKAAVFNEKLEQIYSNNIDYTIESHDDIVEFDGEKYWEFIKNELDNLFIDVHALSVDTQCETLILTDEDGKPVRKAIVWLDNRAEKEARIIEEHFGRKRVYEVTGQPEITATWPASKLLWVKNNEPDVWAKTKKIFLLEDYILYKMTGKFVTEKTLQSSTIYFDINNSCWWQEMLDFIGVSSEMLPELCDSAKLIGEYNGIKVVTGAMDQIAGAIGAGVIKPGVVSEMTGTTMVIFSPCESVPEYNESSIVPCHYNYDGKYCVLSWSPTAGMALKWFKNALCEEFSFTQLDDIAKDIAPGCDGLTFLPYLCGSTMPKYNPKARGSFTGLTPEHTRAHFVRSIMEAMSYMLKSNFDYLGVDAKEIRAMGGGANSDLWCQMKADVTGKTLMTLKNKETACLGSAILAGVGTGVFENVEEACKGIGLNKIYKPENVDYSTGYNNFIEADNLLNK
jgi:xylulokinase